MEAAIEELPSRRVSNPVAGSVNDHRPVVLLLDVLPDFFYNTLSRKFRFLKPWEAKEFATRHDFLAAHADSIEVILCSPPAIMVDAETMAQLPRLRCIVSPSAGLNHVDVGECRRRGIAVANAGEVFTDDVADYAVGLLLDVLRGISAADRYVRKGLWAAKGDYPLGTKLNGKRAGIIGLGSIGSAVAKRLDAFGCVIYYHSRKAKPSASYTYISSVRKLASQCDILIAACALTKDTRHIINKDVLTALGKHGVVINIGRGALIDEKELVRCLVEGEIRGAGLDVFENEPCVPQELFSLDNVVLSPHSAVLTPEALTSLLDLTTKNLEAFFLGKPLLSPYLD